MKVIHKSIPDYKNSEGLWVEQFSVYRDGDQILSTTHAKSLFNNVKYRCSKNSTFVENFPTYKECKFNFFDFQHFASWCNSTPGYRKLQPNNKPWCLDKDILVTENKIYSPETCCFVPEYVNNAFVSRSITTVGMYPLGVTKISGRSKRYSARCQTLSGRKHLGSFATPLKAHSAWQEEKIKHLTEVAILYRVEECSQENVFAAIQLRANIIKEALVAGAETVFV